jgi:F420-0:gamma-glutamyl ligase
MNIQAIKTKLLQPPQDDLLQALELSDLQLENDSVLLISSKVAAIHQGRCIPIDQADKEELVKHEADVYIEQADSRWRLCLKYNTFLAGAGIDESNADLHYVLLPNDPNKFAKELWNWARLRFGIGNIGVVITDSHSMPLRYGTTGVAIGWYGFEPVTYFTGKPDLFGRAAQFTRINVVDSLASAGVFVMGEMSEQTPAAVITNIPHIKFVDRDTSGELSIPPREDIYWPILKKFYE